MLEALELAHDVFEDEETLPELCPIILIHGFLTNKFLFRGLGQDLNRVTKRKVFSLDLRCHGDSPWNTEGNYEMMLADVKKFIQDNHLNRVSFVTHSFSCTISYLVAIDMPECVEKLLLIDCPPFMDYTTKFNEENIFPILISQNMWLRTLKPEKSLREVKTRLLELSQAASPKEAFFYKKCSYDLTKENGIFKWKRDMDYMMQRCIEGYIIAPPRGSSIHEILIIRCQDSTCVPDEKFEAVKRHNPNARLMTFENTSHVLMFENQEKFLQVAKEYFSTTET